MLEFTLKKILSAFLMPLSIGLVVFLIGLIYLFFNNYKKAKLYLVISFLWIFIVGYSPFVATILEPLESKYPKIEKITSVKYILLLGGDFKGRAYEAIRLYNLIDNSKIITSGYPGNYGQPEALRNANKLISLGISKDDILMQVKPKDTEEEAMNIKNIVGNEQFILVTSAYHMPRAIELFNKHGLNPIPAPTNFFLNNSRIISLPNGNNLYKSQIAFHEYIGTLWNKIKQIKSELLN